MALRKPTILYEDSQDKGSKTYPPHDFVRACVVDVLGDDRADLVRSVLNDPRPKSGASKLLGGLRRTTEGGQHVVVVVDDDQIRRQLDLPKASPEDRVIAAIHDYARGADVKVILLQRNLETLLENLQRCGLQHSKLGDALRKVTSARDLVFGSATAPSHRAIRNCVRNANASFDALVAHLAEVVTTFTA